MFLLGHFIYTWDKFLLRKNILCKKDRSFDAAFIPSLPLQILLHKQATSVSLIALCVLICM